MKQTQQMGIMETAEILVAGGMFPDLKTVEQAASLLIVGRGYGLADYDSVTSLYIRQGKLNMHANLMAAAVKSSGKYDYEVRVHNDEECTIEFYRVDRDGRTQCGEHTFTMAQAQRANLTKNFTWKQYPEAMLFARCISAGYRAHCPDALGAAPVYVEQHGELEVDDPKPSGVTAQRAVPEIPQGNAIRQNKEESTKVDESDDWSNGEQKSARVALVDEVLDWSGAPKEEAVGGILKMLSFRELPTDGTADDMDLGLILMHIRESRVIGVTYADAMDDLEIFFAESDKDESPNENDMKLEEAIEF